jgi:hypothetical protein
MELEGWLMKAAKPWIILIYSLPAKPSGKRVSIWKKLKRIGAVLLKNSVYILPYSDELYERLQWLVQEIQAADGDVTLFKVGDIDSMPYQEIVDLFRQSRNKDYKELAAECSELADKLEKVSGGEPGEIVDNFEQSLKVLRERQAEISEIDYFDAQSGIPSEKLLSDIALRLESLRAHGDDDSSLNREKWSPEKLKWKTWVTRPHIHIDRIGSAWLIRRFMDPNAVFIFAAGAEVPEDAVPFDMMGSELSHHGEDCTFETFLKILDKKDKALQDIAEIVHEIDLKDGKFSRPEAPGLDALIRGISKQFEDDEKTLEAGIELFDALYVFLGGNLKGNALSRKDRS